MKTQTFTVTISYWPSRPDDYCSEQNRLSEQDIANALGGYEHFVREITVKEEIQENTESCHTGLIIQPYVVITYGELFDRVWDSTVFSKIGVNEWALNEGLAHRNDKLSLSYQQAKHFMSQSEFDGRKQ